MKNIIIILVLLLLPVSNSLAQNPMNLTFNSTDGGNKTYVAQDNILFLPDYHYTDYGHKLHAYIDKSTGYESFPSTGSFSSSSIDPSLSVGAIDGSSVVSETGAAVYSVPIELPIGTNKLKPNLNLLYSSQQGDGTVGIGWALQGVSEINLSPDAWYYEKETENIEIDGSDKFSLDGGRLFATSGTYGSSGTTYGTEVETYSKVTSYGYAGVPDWFKVETKDGLTMELGRTTDSKYWHTGGHVVRWRVNKIYDQHGNYIEFKYRNEGEKSLLDRILYTGNESTGVDPYNVVKFRYSVRDDKNSRFVAGKQVRSDHVLEKIEIHSNGEHYKDFVFEYGLNHNSFLHTLTEIGSNGDELNSTLFKYGAKGADFQSINCSTFAGMSADFQVSRDFNSDGKSDMLVRNYYYDGGGAKVYTTWKVYISDGLNSFSQYASGSIPSGYHMFFDHNLDDIKIPGISTSLDYFGDGSDDILLIRVSSSGSGSTLSGMKIIDINGLNSTTTHSISYTSGGYITPSKFLHIGDYDGDGRDDILLLRYPNSTNFTCSGKLITSHSGQKNVNLGGLAYINSAHQVLPTDFDGDGKSELMLLYDNSCEIFEINSQPVSGTYQVEKIYHSASPGFPTRWHTIIPGDFNGDGKTDILTSGDNVSWSIGFSSGKHFAVESFTFQHTYSPTSSNHSLKIGDYNGDGKTDILHAYGIWSGGISTESKVDVYYSKGHGFNYKSFLTDLITSHGDFVVGDFNGDGKYEIFNRDHYAQPAAMYYFNRDGKDYLLNKVRDGYGRVTTFDYDWLSKGSIYSNVSYSTVINHEMPKPLPVVKKVTTPNGIGGNTTVSYTYGGAKWNTQGKGFFGFLEVHSSNSTTGYKTTVENELIADAYIPGMYILLKKNEFVELISDGTPVSEKTYSNDITGLGGVRVQAEVSGMVEKDLINNLTQTTSYSYDAYGNITHRSVGNGVETVSTNSTYTSFGSWWIPSRLASKTVYRSRTGEPVIIRSTDYQYTTDGDVQKEIMYPGTAQQKMKTYFYDSFGNTKRIMISASGEPTSNNSRVYDGKGRFVVEEKNSLGQETTTTVHNLWGKPTKITDISGQSSEYTYDQFGRLVSSKDTKGNITSIARAWSLSPISSPVGTQSALFSVTTSTPGAPQKVVWYDIFKREIRQQLEGLASNIFSVSSFDERGLIKKSSAPYFAGDSPVITTYNYDQFSRPTSTSSLAGTTTYSYVVTALNRTVTINSPAQTTSQTMDKSGRVITSTDDAGSLNFEYHADGMQKSVSMDGVALVKTVYDGFGNQTSLIDKNAGTTTYEYNEYGQLVSQTDANGNTYTLDYDVLGRETSKTGPDGTTTTQYVSAGNGLNKIKKITSPDGIVIEYEYDEFGRAILEKEVVGSDVFASGFEYDQYDNITAMIYPSGFVARFNFNGSGYLQSVTNDLGTEVLFSLPEQNARGQYTAFKLGNGVTTQKSYDQFGFTTDIYAAGIQDHVYDFNIANGNLLKRYDYLKDRVEIFQYDASNRLTESVIGMITTALAGIPLETTYSDNGNIESKGFTGNYTYDANKINAVTSIDNPSSIISLDQQDVTYTPFDRVSSISEGDFIMNFSYGPDLNRVKTEFYDDAILTKTKFYIGAYEKEVTSLGEKEIHHIPTGDGTYATYVIDESGTGEYFYLYKDHLGSNVAVTDASATVVLEQNFDAWGRRRNPINWNYSGVSIPSSLEWVKGFTGQEHMDAFDLINLNNRLYDPIIGRMLSADNFIQDRYHTQGYNRYSYGFNNPLSFTDPSGEIAAAPIIIGAVVGAYMGGTLANNNPNPFEWNFGSGKTWGYMLGGAVVGGVSGAIGSGIASSGIAFANTLAIINSSIWYSVGTALYTNGATDVSVNFGFASYNFSQQEWGYLAKKGNSFADNLGYSLGAIQNVADLLAGFKTGEVQLATEHSDFIGHSAITEVGETNSKSSIVSFGPDHGNNTKGKGLFDPTSRIGPEANWSNHLGEADVWVDKIGGVNVNRLEQYGNWTKSFKYNLYYSSCVNHTARALTLSGVPVIGIHPFVLRFQIYLRSIGVRPSMFTYYYTGQ